MQELLREMEMYAAEYHVPIINERGRGVLLAAVQQAQPRRILEIGTAIGYSTLLMAQQAASGAHIVTLELSEERAALAARFLQRSPYAAQIEQQVGDAAVLLTRLTGPFDFVFIDAAKGQYVDYFHKVLPLLSSCGVVTADNVLFRGYVLGTEKPPRRYKTIVKRLREYIALVQNMPGFVTEIHENGDGLAVSRRIQNDQKA